MGRRPGIPLPTGDRLHSQTNAPALPTPGGGAPGLPPQPRTPYRQILAGPILNPSSFVNYLAIGLGEFSPVTPNGYLHVYGVNLALWLTTSTSGVDPKVSASLWRGAMPLNLRPGSPSTTAELGSAEIATLEWTTTATTWPAIDVTPHRTPLQVRERLALVLSPGEILGATLVVAGTEWAIDYGLTLYGVESPSQLASWGD